MPKDHGRHIDLLCLVLHYWDALPIVPDPDLVVLPGRCKNHPVNQNTHTLYFTGEPGKLCSDNNTGYSFSANP